MQIMAPKKNEKKNKQTCCSSTPIRSLLITITNPGFFEKDSLAMTLQQQNAVDEQFIQHWKWGTKTTSFKGFHLSPSQRQLVGFPGTFTLISLFGHHFLQNLPQFFLSPLLLLPRRWCKSRFYRKSISSSRRCCVAASAFPRFHPIDAEDWAVVTVIHLSRWKCSITKQCLFFGGREGHFWIWFFSC